MAERQDELLVDVCARIRAHPYPAYAKSSDLRYLAVNDAYAALCGCDPAAMIGKGDGEIAALSSRDDLDERERRCLIFGSREQARHVSPGGGEFEIALQRERMTDELTVLTARFQPAGADAANADACLSRRPPILSRDIALLPGSGEGSRPAEPAAIDSAVEGALDAMGAGVAVFGPDDRLRYANRTMRDFYRMLVGEAAEGPVALSRICHGLFDMEAADGDRDDWVRARLASYALPLFETVTAAPGGWMRLITQRRPDGALVALRVDVTALKENEGRVRAHSQEISLYRALLDELPVASFMRDEEQRLIFANRAYLDLVSSSAEEIVGRTTLDMYPAQGPMLHAHNQRVLETGELLETEIAFERPDGTAVPTISRIYRVTTLDEKRYLIGSITDTTVLKKREDQLIDAQRQAEAIRSDLESIVSSLPVGIVVVDETGIIEHVNGAFEALWDGDLPPMKRRPFGELVRFQNDRGGVRADEAGHEERLSSIRAGALPTREVAYSNGRTLIEAGQAISGGRCLLTYFDITERREREREVLETRSALEEVGSLVKDAVSSMNQGLLIFEDGKVVLSNEALLAMIAMPADLLRPGAALSDILQSCVERGIRGFLGEEIVEAADFPSVLLTGKEVTLTIFSGLKRWVKLDVTPTGHGRSVLVFTDITDLKNREEELRQLVVRAETADKAKSEFLANMSHEIRTPMNGVLGMAELLAQSSLDTRQKTFIDIMVKSGNALLTIINDILDFSKIDAGQMTLRDVAFSPVEAIEDVATLLSARAGEKDIELVVKGAAGMPAMVTGDAGRFRQIVTNLVGNAVKFTDRGHVLIDLDCAARQDGRVDIVVRVEDTGAGIPSDKMDAIFEKFSQVDTSSTRRHEGTGLGLTIADGLTRLFGGTLRAESDVGRGSVFTVRLPMTPVATAAPQIAPAVTKGARVLIVDAHAVSREAAHDLLLDWGFDATAVGTVAEAQALLAAAADIGVAVDAIVLDYQPDIGANFVRALRASPMTAGISLIVLTSVNMPGDDRLLSSRDIQAHLMKPVRADLLRETVCEVVRAARGRRSSARGGPDGGKVLPLRPQGAGEPAFAPAVPAGEGLDVLVAEDNDVNQILFTQLLQGAGVRFRLVTNGEQAVAAFRQDRPRMVLMDVSMPVMNGLQASRAIREIEEEEEGAGRVPIVAVTAHVLDEDREACLAAGMDDHLTKPISLERLEEKLDRWLNRAKPRPLTLTRR